MNDNTVRALLIKDGDDFYLRSLGAERVHIAYIDTSITNTDNEVIIHPLIPGAHQNVEADTLLDLAKADMENYVRSGNFDRDREITRLNKLVPLAANTD